MQSLKTLVKNKKAINSLAKKYEAYLARQVRERGRVSIPVTNELKTTRLLTTY